MQPVFFFWSEDHIGGRVWELLPSHPDTTDEFAFCVTSSAVRGDFEQAIPWKELTPVRGQTVEPESEKWLIRRLQRFRFR